MRGGHEGGHFFVPGLDEPDFFLSAVESAEDAVEAVSRVTENLLYTRGPQLPKLGASLFQMLRT